MHAVPRILRFQRAIFAVGFIAFWGFYGNVGSAADAPAPLLEAGRPVDWWFVYKLNVGSFPFCGDGVTRACIFGGTVQDYRNGFSQQFLYASSAESTLKPGNACVGDTVSDPVGATFDQVYNGEYYYVIWNDQFYNDPDLPACRGRTYCDIPWGHSKGMLAWNGAGAGFVMQVTTPDWPAAGNKNFPRTTDGNTLGCIAKDNNVKVSQHFFALKLTKDDVVKVLFALHNASVVTEHGNASITNRQIINNGGPPDVGQLVESLGVISGSGSYTKEMLSSRVQLISKPAGLPVPPWQMVSALLGRAPLKVATWRSTSKIPDTNDQTTIGCWDTTLLGEPRAAVANATSGQWNGTPIGLEGGNSPNGNHAKIGVSTTGSYAIFGDMNQEGTLDPVPGSGCGVHQNARGGLFFVLEDEKLSSGLRDLMTPVGNTGSPPGR